MKTKPISLRVCRFCILGILCFALCGCMQKIPIPNASHLEIHIKDVGGKQKCAIYDVYDKTYLCDFKFDSITFEPDLFHLLAHADGKKYLYTRHDWKTLFNGEAILELGSDDSEYWWGRTEKGIFLDGGYATEGPYQEYMRNPRTIATSSILFKKNDKWGADVLINSGTIIKPKMRWVNILPNIYDAVIMISAGGNVPHFLVKQGNKWSIKDFRGRSRQMRLCGGCHASPYGSEMFYPADLRLNNKTTMWATYDSPDITGRYIRDCLSIPTGATKTRRPPYNSTYVRYGHSDGGYIVAAFETIVNQCSGVDDSEL